MKDEPIMKILVLCIVFVISNMCDATNPIQKCCDDGYYIYGQKNCLKFDESTTWNPAQIIVYNEELTKVGRFYQYFTMQPSFFSNEDYKQKSNIYLVLYKDFYLLDNGSALLENELQRRYLDPEDFCLDLFKYTKNNVTRNVIFYKDKNKEINWVYKTGMLISAIFLLLLLVVYMLLPELRTLGGMILMGYAGSFMLSYLFYFTIQIIKNRSPLTCRVLTFLIYYFLVSSFCWTFVMSYDIWWTFRGYAKARPVHRNGVRHKFLLYSLFAWGVPLLMTVVIAVLNEVETTSLPSMIKPEIPRKGCFLSDPVKIAYLYGPMLILILANWLCFGLTVYNIHRLSRGTQILSGNAPAAAGSPSAHRTQKHRLCLYLKVSLVMGLSWVFEVVSASNPTFAGWYISDTFNAFTGLLIFLIFVCKKKIWKSLKKRYNPNKEMNSYSSQSRSKTRTSTESTLQSVPLKSVDISNGDI